MKPAATMLAALLLLMVAPSLALVNPKFNTSDYVVDLGSLPKAVQGPGGSAIVGILRALPVLDSVQLSFVETNLKPNGVFPLHYHPRADEGFYIVKGTVRTCFAEETGGQTICNTYPAGTAGFYPLGTIHFQQAVGNEDALIISVLNSNDPGISIEPYGIFELPTDVLASAYGTTPKEIANLRKSLPDPFPFINKY